MTMFSCYKQILMHRLNIYLNNFKRWCRMEERREEREKDRNLSREKEWKRGGMEERRIKKEEWKRGGKGERNKGREK